MWKKTEINTTKIKRVTDTRNGRGDKQLTARYSTLSSTLISVPAVSHSQNDEVLRLRNNELLAHTIHNTRITNLILLSTLPTQKSQFVAYLKIMRLFRQFVAGHSKGPAKLRFVADELTLGRVFFSQYFGFPLSISFHQSCTRSSVTSVISY